VEIVPFKLCDLGFQRGKAISRRDASMGRRCLFCNEVIVGNRAKEHVIPQWLIDHLNSSDNTLTQGVAHGVDGEVLEVRLHDMMSYVQGKVCEECNTGWMSKLEAAAKPILIPLIEGGKSLSDSSNEQRVLVSRWAVKTAYVVSATAPKGSDINPEHMRHIAGDSKLPPKGVAVFGRQHTHNGEFSYLLKSDWPEWATVPILGAPQSHPQSYKVALQIRQLMLLVCHWPPPIGSYIIEEGVHFQLWPASPPYPRYKPNFPAAGPDSHQQLARFNFTLAVAHISGL
jgi:hypothetical protein